MGGHSKAKPLTPLPDAPDPNAGSQAASEALKPIQRGGRQSTVLASSLLRHVPGQDNPAAQTTQSVGQQDQQNRRRNLYQIGTGGAVYGR